MQIRISDPRTFIDKVAEAKRLKECQKVVVLIDDIDGLLKIFDIEVVCDILDGIPFYETAQYNWGER